MPGRIENKRFMMEAVELAKKGGERTFPNPRVGAVVVKNGKIAGKGYHGKAGAPHAEVIALRKAGKRAKGADLYVTLEPCAHYGRTPPCVNTIIKSGVKKVYAAMRDPNPLVNGKGLGGLRKNGIKVMTGLCRKEARKLNGAYLELIAKNQKKD